MDPNYRALPADLQARLEVALTLGAQMHAISKITEALQDVLQHEAPQYTAFGTALTYHVQLMQTYFKAAERHAYGAGWRR